MSEPAPVTPLVPTASWATPREAIGLCLRPATLRRTVLIALMVGTILSLVNQAGVVAGGDATLATWLRVAANFVVPFCVSNAGILTATRRPQPPQ